LIISSDLPKHAQKCQLFLVVFHRQSVINQLLLQIWEPFKKELPQLNLVLLHLSKQYTYLQMIWQIQLQLLHSLTWMQQLCCQEHWQS
jgi:dihydroorotase